MAGEKEGKSSQKRLNRVFGDLGRDSLDEVDGGHRVEAAAQVEIGFIVFRLTALARLQRLLVDVDLVTGGDWEVGLSLLTNW